MQSDPTLLLAGYAAAVRADLAALRYDRDADEPAVFVAGVLAHTAAAGALAAFVAAQAYPPTLQMFSASAATPFPDGSVLLAPLVVAEACLGMLVFFRREATPFTPDEQAFAAHAADREAAAVQRDRAVTQAGYEAHLLERLIDSIPSSLLVIDDRLRVVAVNRNFLEKARRSARATIGRPVSDVFPPVLARYIRMHEKVAAVFQSGVPLRDERIAFRAPGLPTRIFFYHVIPLGPADRVERVLLLMDDITERERLGEEARRAERYLASLVECAGDLVASLDRDGRIVSWNRAAEALSGRAAQSVSRRRLVDLCVPQEAPALSRLLAQLADGASGAEVEAALLNGATAVPVAWRGAPMHDDHGNVVAFVVVGRDLTERRRLEAQLIQSAKSASLGVMAGGIAHEIRNPLGIITAAAHLLEEEPCSNAFHSECAVRIERAVQRAATIIEDLLTFARPNQSPPGLIDLNDLIEDALALLSHQPAMRRISLIRELRTDLPPILGRQGLLQQVVTNILLNACQAMPDGGTLRVATQFSTDGGVQMLFQDSGRGIAPDVLPHIFDPFFTTMPAGQSTGLGLAICTSIVAQHNGSMSVDSAVDRGTTFVVRLPAESAAAPLERDA